MRKYIFILVNFIVFNQSYGSCQDRLYAAVIEGAEQPANKAILSKALQIVINRLTPGKNDLTNPVITRTNIAPLIQSKEYYNKGRTKILRVCFKPEAINQLMERAGQQPWITTRPKLVTWVFFQEKNNESIIDPREHPAILNALSQASKEKELELIYPDVDYEQAYKKISHAERKLLALVEISKTMNAEAVLYITLNANDPPYLWEEWQAYYQNKVGPGYVNNRATPNNAGRYAMTGVSKFLFESGEKRSIKGNSIYVKISNIQTAHDYYKMDEFIKEMPGVLDTDVNSVTEDAVLYTLDIEVPQNLLEMRLADKYELLANSGEDGILRYRFIK